MKKFIIINEIRAYVIERDNLQEAVQYAENICDHSREIIVREIKYITDHTKTYEQQ